MENCFPFRRRSRSWASLTSADSSLLEKFYRHALPERPTAAFFASPDIEPAGNATLQKNLFHVNIFGETGVAIGCTKNDPHVCVALEKPGIVHIGQIVDRVIEVE